MSSHGTPNPFVPAWWLRGRHAQTLWGKFARRTRLPPSGSLDQWDTPDGDFIEVFRLPAPSRAPRLLVLHGLEGGLRSHYVRGILRQAAIRGWAADVLIFRGCGRQSNCTARFYHSGETGDLEFVARRIAQESPDDPLFVVGYSLGGNVLLKWLGEPGSRLPASLCAAAAVSVPYDLEAGARCIHRGASRVYERHFLGTLKAKVLSKNERFPGIVDACALRAVRSLVDFDEMVTAPLHGFSDARDYYRRSSALQFLPSIRTPTRLISSYDDPFLPSEALSRAAELALANPALLPTFSHRGGHVGFVSGSVPGLPRYYAEREVLAFFATQLERVANSS